jgi:hypothetical protein
LPSEKQARASKQETAFVAERDLLPVITKIQSVGRSKSWGTTLLKRVTAVSVLMNFKSVHSKNHSTFVNAGRFARMVPAYSASQSKKARHGQRAR